jgi:hypothetical protein
MDSGRAAPLPPGREQAAKGSSPTGRGWITKNKKIHQMTLITGTIPQTENRYSVLGITLILS